MMRATPLKRGRPLRRKTWMRSRKGNTSYSRRERDVGFMLWVRRQPCVLRAIRPFLFMDVAKAVGVKAETACCGPVEADHQGARGLGQKADDRTCVPMCRDHHAERTDHRGSFRPLTRDEARAWRAAAIEHTQAAWAAWSSNQ